MPESRLTRWGVQRGDDLLVPDTGDADALIHVSSVQGAGFSSLSEGQRLEYDLNRDARRGVVPPTCEPASRPVRASSAMSRANAWAAGRRRRFA